ncbi:16S rRNA (guanine(527)-N(7))-methyltransferase RsmG [Loktanella sp. Alg231-35]|uniref:16S rRNA (guanine(527)-N(7))-methyltransferase RsmG n=1 Tax=Loktanella sp. Alg231-35 TaxID=1922220 RepID=UPI000D558E06|nr:16S rRNA (guanine(527)-N(7))-methyltransferase RsmG [Loktanella sp. Alg231-35]
MTGQIACVDVSRETIADLESFAALTTKWTQKINLISRNTSDAIWDRHIVDSVQIYRYAPKVFTKWVDLGSGGGFPGIVMAILGKARHPEAQFTLIESDQRKAAFLRTAARDLSLKVDVIAKRVGDVAPQEADVVSARALAPLSALLGMTSRHLHTDGVALLPKGKQAQQEIAEAQKSWRFQLEDHASFTDPEACILAIQRIESRGQ